MSFAEREPLRHRYPHGPYSMLGPVEVTGAEVGDIVECTLVTLRTIGWGWNSFPLGVGALPADFAEPYLHYFRFDGKRTVAEFTHGIRLPLAPFLGVIGVEPAGDQQTSAILAGSYGGNLVMRDLTAGASLFLPVAKPGARVWIGDVHALQGDGVVDQTAIETAADTASSDRDTDVYLALFTDDAVLDGDQGDYQGKDALRRAAGSVWAAEPAASLHLTLNAILEPAGNRPGEPGAVARPVLLIVEPAPQPRIWHIARITQHVRRLGGAWRITRRTVTTAGEAP